VDDGLLRYEALAARLNRLPHRLQVVFAAGCAERALPVLEYEDYPGGPGFLPAFRTAVEAVWAAALNPTFPPEQLAAACEAVEAVFPEGDQYTGYYATIIAGAAVLRAVDAVDDPSGRAVADVALHVWSAYQDEEPADEIGWQEQAVELLERWGGGPIGRDIFDSLPSPPKLGAG
jgi:hypothetical protein